MLIKLIELSTLTLDTKFLFAARVHRQLFKVDKIVTVLSNTPLVPRKSDPTIARVQYFLRFRVKCSERHCEIETFLVLEYITVVKIAFLSGRHDINVLFVNPNINLDIGIRTDYDGKDQGAKRPHICLHTVFRAIKFHPKILTELVE